MRDSGSSVGKIAGKEADAILNAAGWVCPVLMFAYLIVDFPSNMFVDPSMFEKGPQVTLNQ